MNRQERDRFTADTPDDIAYGEGACLETPRFVFDRLHERFYFDVDLTANERNHLLPCWFGPGSPAAPDALTHAWTARLGIQVETSGYTPAQPDQTFPDGTVLRIPGGAWQGGYWDTVDPKSGYSNPPYGAFIPKILKKAVEERAKGFTSVFLLPNRSAAWFKDWVIPYYSELWYLSSRLTFPYLGKPRLNPKTGKPDGALFDSIIVVYKPYGKEWGLFPPAQRPNVWNPKTGELRY